MLNLKWTLTLAAVMTLFVSAPVSAQKTATATTLKVGYFNLALVKASSPDAAGSETLKNQAEQQLRHDVEEANKRLQKAQSDKKPTEEVQKLAKEIQLEINAKQQALATLVQNATQQASAKIYAASAQVAQERGLDLVIDGAGVFAGGQKIIDNGQDITAEVIKKVNPSVSTSNSGSSAASSATAPVSAQKAQSASATK